MDINSQQDTWKEDEVLEIMTNPIYVGLGTVPAIVDMDLFSRTGASLVKEIGAREYLGRIYDNLRDNEEFTGRVPALGTREDFISRQTPKLRGAATKAHGIRKLIEHLRDQLAPS
jgi:hypothetical protein